MFVSGGLSLIPAFSPRRRRIAIRWPEMANDNSGSRAQYATFFGEISSARFTVLSFRRFTGHTGDGIAHLIDIGMQHPYSPGGRRGIAKDDMSRDDGFDFREQIADGDRLRMRRDG